jgi:hypothetical protein
MHQWELVEVPRCDWFFSLVCRGPQWTRRWMLIQPFRWLMFRKVQP